MQGFVFITPFGLQPHAIYGSSQTSAKKPCTDIFVLEAGSSHLRLLPLREPFLAQNRYLIKNNGLSRHEMLVFLTKPQLLNEGILYTLTGGQ